MQQEQPPPLEILEPENSKPFSPSIMKLAQSYELGEPQHEYRASFPHDPRVRATGLTIAIWLLSLLTVLLTIRLHLPFLWIIIWTTVAALVLTLLIWAVTFLLYYRRQKTHYQRAYVCTSGLLCQRSSTFDVIHWHHIETVKYDAVGNCHVHHSNGTVFLSSPPFQQLGELSAHIEQAITPYRLPQLLTSYRDGLPILFGPLHLNQQGIGIGLTQKSITLFTWNQIQGIERRFDNLILKFHNDRALSLPLTVHEIPNANLAQALIHTILDQSEQITQKLPDDSTPGQLTPNRSGVSPDPQTDGTQTTSMGAPIGTATSDRLSVVVYQQGFLYLNKVSKKLDIVVWDQIAQVIRRTHTHLDKVEYSIEVTCNNKTMFVFPRNQPPIAGIGLYVEQKAAEWALPALLTQYNANETTAFGKLTINQEGIIYNKHRLPWSEVYQMHILQPNSRHIDIKQRGYNREWQSIPMNKVPDVYLLKLLIDHILSTHPAVQR